jgi:hypothetical protein
MPRSELLLGGDENPGSLMISAVEPAKSLFGQTKVVVLPQGCQSEGISIPDILVQDGPRLSKRVRRGV